MLVATVKDVKETQPVISQGCAQREGKGTVHPAARIPSDILSAIDEVVEVSVCRLKNRIASLRVIYIGKKRSLHAVQFALPPNLIEKANLGNHLRKVPINRDVIQDCKQRK